MVSAILDSLQSIHTALPVVDEHGEGFPVAWCTTDKEDRVNVFPLAPSACKRMSFTYRRVKICVLSVRGEDDPIIIEVESKSSAYYLLLLSLLEGR